MPQPSLVYWTYRALNAVGAHAPAAVGTAVSRAAAAVAWRLQADRRRLMAGHLARISGGSLSGPDLERAVRGAFESYRRYWLESSRVASLSATDLESRSTASGLGHLDDGLARGRGVILALPHLGNWDEGGAWLASIGYPLTVVAEELEPPRLFEWFVAQRRALGIRAVPLGPAAAAAVSGALRDGAAVALVCDRDVGGTGVEVDFFGEATRLPAGPALLALRTGATLIPSAVYQRDGRGVHSVMLRPLDVRRTTRPLREDVRDLTQALARDLEDLIRAAPEQWHVFQPNWPSDPGYSG